MRSHFVDEVIPMGVLISDSQGSTSDNCHCCRRSGTPFPIITSAASLVQVYLLKCKGIITNPSWDLSCGNM